MGKTNEEKIEELMKRVEANDAGAIYVLGSYYYHGQIGLQRDLKKAMDLWTQAAELGSSQAHFSLGNEYRQRGDSKKATFHYETAAMAGHEVARYLLGTIEEAFGNMERAVKHWIIASSAGSHHALWHLQQVFEKGLVSRDAMDSILTAYNNSCVEMRSEARDKRISYELTHIENRV
jgi:TPR repeat protein